jgi:serine/threonine protein phosphatase PrpC
LRKRWFRKHLPPILTPSHKPNKMNYEICTQTDPGLTRDNNEDAVAFDASTRLCILADGMGGYNAGEIASGMAAAFIKSEMGRWLSQAGRHANAKEVRRALEICVENANHSIFNAANSNPQYAGMGTTLVVGVFQDGRLMLGHIGDSRCYRLRGQELQQITKDHSLLQEQIDAGLITPEQALTSLNKNLVTRALGVEDTVLVEVNEYRVDAGDLYLMCSDGLSDMVADPGIAAILMGAGTLEQKARQLVVAANEAGGRDNISVLLAYAKEDSTKRGLLSRMLGK